MHCIKKCSSDVLGATDDLSNSERGEQGGCFESVMSVGHSAREQCCDLLLPRRVLGSWQRKPNCKESVFK